MKVFASTAAPTGIGRDRRDEQGGRGLSRKKTVRDLSTAPAWIAPPQLSGVVDLVRTEAFPVDKKKARPKRRRWGEDWQELVIGASPYNRVSFVICKRQLGKATVDENISTRKGARHKWHVARGSCATTYGYGDELTR